MQSRKFKACCWRRMDSLGMIFSVKIQNDRCSKQQVNINYIAMRTDNRDSEKDLNANPESRLNTNKPVSKPDKFPESQQARDEMEKQAHQDKDDEVELLAGEVSGTVSSRDTSSDPQDIAGVADIDRGLRRGRKR